MWRVRKTHKIWPKVCTGVLQADAAVLQRAALEKVHRCYSQQSVAQQYLAIYQGKELEGLDALENLEPLTSNL